MVACMMESGGWFREVSQWAVYLVSLFHIITFLFLLTLPSLNQHRVGDRKGLKASVTVFCIPCLIWVACNNFFLESNASLACVLLCGSFFLPIFMLVFLLWISYKNFWKTIILGFSRSRIRGCVFAEKVKIWESWRSCTVQLFWIGGYANIKGREGANITFDVSDHNIYISNLGETFYLSIFHLVHFINLINWQYILYKIFKVM